MRHFPFVLLMMAICGGAILIGLTVRVNRDRELTSAAYAGATRGDIQVLSLALQCGAFPGTLYQDDKTLLHLAGSEPGDSAEPRAAILELLIRHGADVNAVDRLGRTPLMTVALLDDAEACRVLLTAGADPRIRDNDGKSALDHAIEANAARCVGLLRERAVAEAHR